MSWHFLYRLANIVHLNPLSVDKIWNVLKKRKSENIFNKTCITITSSLAFDADIFSSVVELEKLFQVNYDNDVEIFTNISDINLRLAGDMFLYIYPCSDVMMPWLKFYINLFRNNPLDHILLTLNRILKSNNSRQNKNLKSIAKKLLGKINSTPSLKLLDLHNINAEKISITSIKGKNILKMCFGKGF